jgi:uncharacterized membrane protein
MALLSNAGIEFLLRWVHFFAGITWIGLLYYFNFVQGPFFAEADAATKSAATQKLVPRALWWFRWGAMLTFLSGALILFQRGDYTSPWATTILTGAAFGTAMFLNVWLVIWPNQKIVIANAVGTAGGAAANPAAPAAARRAFLASRTNVLFSFPMLFFMGAASHFTFSAPSEPAMYWGAIALLIVVLEANALTGDKGPTKQPIETVRSVIISGIVLALIVYFIAEALP